MIMKGGTTLPKLAKGFPRTDQSRSGRRYRLQDLFCSSRRCAPIINALQKGTDEINPVKPNTIAIGNPADGYYVLQAIRETGGWGESVTDEEILEGIHPFGPNRGNIYRACWAYRSGCNQEAIQNGKIPPGESIVISVTGNGYKTLEAVARRVEKPLTITATFGKLRRNSTNTLTRRQLPSRKLWKSNRLSNDSVRIAHFLQGSWQEFILVK